jgi:electron transfer flavoprotein alpha subunit
MPRKEGGQWQGIWVFMEQNEGHLEMVSLELLHIARVLQAKRGKGEVWAILLGHQVRSLAEKIATCGAERVLWGDHPSLANYLCLPYTRIVSQLVMRYRPEIFLFPATSLGTDLAARVAIRVGTGLSAHCTGLEINEKGELLQVVPAFGGKVMAIIQCKNHRPQMATVRPGVFRGEKVEGIKGRIEEVPVEISPLDARQRLVAVYPERALRRPIEEAEIVVAGGAGIGSREDWKWVEELAEVLNASVGGTRPPLDEGWIREEQMIGQSGKTIRPKLYINIGVSGVMQHTVGIQDAKVIVSINQDPKAAIFECSDLGVVADFREILPLLIEKLKQKA